MSYVAGLLLFYILMDEPDEATIVLNCGSVMEQVNAD